MLVNTKQMMLKAYKEKYAVGAFNVNNMELVQGIIEACVELKSPVILQASAGAIKYAGLDNIKGLSSVAATTAEIPIALHLDHGENYDICKKCIDFGFTSVMIDASHHSLDENIQLTKRVVEYARKVGGNDINNPSYICVEAELGRLAGIEDNINVSDSESSYTDPKQVQEFVAKTQIDSLAIAIGTSHGAFKFKGDAKLRYDILQKVTNLVPSFPLVLHGASSVPQKFVEIINANGGDVKGAKGVPEEMLRQATQLGISKINIDSDLRMAFTAGIREYVSNNPTEFDPRSYLKHARDYVKQLVKGKIINVLGSNNKA